MDRTYNTNRIWTTNNGFIRDNQIPSSPGNLSVHTPVSGHTSTRAYSGNGVVGDNVSRNNNGAKSPPVLHLYPNNNFVGVESRFRRKYYHKTLLVLLIILVIVLVITIIVLAALLHNQSINTICRTNECLRTSASLIYSMDEETDPCEDFYQFTCGRWSQEHPRPETVTSNDWFRERQAKIMRELRDFLKTNVSTSEPDAVGKAKLMYKACMDLEQLEEREMEPLVYFLKEFKLPLIPRGLNVTLSPDSAKKYNTTQPFNWLDTIVLIKKHLGMDLIFGFDIFPDPLNRTVNRIALGTPETDSALPFNNDDVHKILHKIRKKTIFSGDDEDDDMDIEGREEEEAESTKETNSGLHAYISYVKKVIEVYMSYLDPDMAAGETDEGAEAMTMAVVKVARKIYKLKSNAENATQSSKNPIDDLVYISVKDLQTQTDKLLTPKALPIWEPYLQQMFDTTSNDTKFNASNIEIITSNADILYMQTIAEYLLEIPTSHLEFYLWLSAVEELILHTTSEMRLLHAEYLRLVIGTEGNSPRSIYCAHGINSLMGMAVSYALADDDFTRHKLPNVRRMLSDIRRSFNNLVRSTTWMDGPTKYETLQKSAEMKSFIGYPEWLTNATTLDDFYEDVHVNASTHLENMVGVLRWQMQIKLNNLNVPEPFGWATSPSNVNAFHTFQANAITIPIAILQYPFYDLGLEALNYGSIGTILGHELTHGFDDSGRMFDKNGNMVQWWSNETISEYVNRTECFVEQYGRYYLDDIEEYIDGELTLGENIADNGGMREAFHAYRLFIKENGREKMRLPGLEHYSHEQLFFISFGNLWCEAYTPAASRYAVEDSHCPGRFRLKGVLTNSQEFADTFNCPPGSGMNPKGPKCRIW
ncbi:M13 family metallopeptidase neprilysin 5 [Musca autumnalis]|uniref:M13 family metallopeptidase neprilysin 5 n=1 Tax=Musca autumnalis TaxID=221902 RepID=UPI003CF2FB7B